jgi:bifunctional UDP-N-acetylglucosamine pyrophosphorylase/glucosamine-1-phosphate N-acetyltransferase
MVGHVVDTLDEIKVNRTVVVVGHGAESVQRYLNDRVEYALQESQLGTGHAVLQAKPLLEREEGITIVIYGDTPLVKEETLRAMIDRHQTTGAAATLMSADVPNPFGYGRIIRDAAGRLDRIVEQKDCTPDEAQVREINAGTYCFNNKQLFAALDRVGNNNAQGEYYLTDVIDILKRDGGIVEAYCTDDATEALGVNDRLQLSEAERCMRERINRTHMLNGVAMSDPANTYIEKGVRIGADTVLLPGVILRGNTSIGEGCEIGPFCDIVDSTIGNEVTVKQSVMLEAQIGDGTSVGPFAYVRPGSNVGKGARIGDFVELKNATIGDGSKVSHLSYVGDAEVGAGVNFGCGAITVNYDGFNKSMTHIGDGAFIGSNVNLIAPVRIGDNAYVVAGSTITHDVEENDLAIARERQTNKPGYAEIIRRKMKASKNKD